MILLREDFDVHVEVVSPSIFITRINEVKVDFVRFRYKMLYPIGDTEGVRMPDIRDIAAMKLDAVTKRGSKKDFYDIYFLLKEMTLKELLQFHYEKFQHSTQFHVIKSLNYFEDADPQDDPIVFDKKVTWQLVKTTLVKEVRNLYI